MTTSAPARIVPSTVVTESSGAAPTLGAALLGFFMVTLDAVIVNVALPSIRRDLGGGIGGLQWVIDGYTLMFAALLLSSGALADRVGARRAFGLGLAVFVAASAACGLSPNLATLVAARFVQGSAAAAMMPSCLTLIRQSHPDQAGRARAVALWAMGGAVASSSGPVLGGTLTLVSWRLIFFVNLPVGAVALRLLARAEPSPTSLSRFDWAGQTTAVLAMGGLTYAAIATGSHGLSSPSVLAAFATAAVALSAFVVIQARVRHPMMPLGLFRVRNLSVASTVGFGFMVGYYGLPFVMSLYLQQHRGLTALMTGVVFLPMMLIGALLTPTTPRFARRFGARSMVTAGLAIMAAGLAALGMAPLGMPLWAIATMMVLVGLAGPLAMPPVTAVLLDSIPSQQAGTASGIFNTARQIGGALAVAVFGALVAQPGQLTNGAHTSLLIAAVVALTAAATSLRLRPDAATQHLQSS
jgi:EmrB/QacA subfamily drug resistance transporter